MYIDFAMAAILIIFIIRGDRRGLKKSLIGCFGWAVSAIIAYIWYPELVTYISTKTQIATNIITKIVYFSKVKLIQEMGLTDGNTASSVISMIQESADSSLTEAACVVAGPIADAVLFFGCFIVIMAAVRIVYGFITMIFKLIADERTPSGAIDSLTGIVVSVVEAAVIIYFILIMLIFVALVGDIPFLTSQIENSVAVSTIERVGLVPESTNLMALMLMR